MYRISILFIAIALLTGCTGKASSRDESSGLSAYTDNETGCQYLFKKVAYAGGMTARISPDGITHLGCRG